MLRKKNPKQKYKKLKKNKTFHINFIKKNQKYNNSYKIKKNVLKYL